MKPSPTLTPTKLAAPLKNRIWSDGEISWAAKADNLTTVSSAGNGLPIISTVANHAQSHPSQPCGSAAEYSPRVLFNRGSDKLTPTGLRKTHKLADYLRKNTEVRLSLKGHTDRRGTDEYNNVLAQERAKSVNDTLIALGIEQTRIRYSGHGSSYSKGTKGDFRGYAGDRRVEIELQASLTSVER